MLDVEVSENFEKAFPSAFSVRTEYRRIRIRYIRSTIAMLMDMMLMSGQRLEKIPLSFFKNIKNSVAGELNLEKESDREMAGVAICGNEHHHAPET